MANYVDLEIVIRRDGDDYAVELRCSHPEIKETEVRSGYSLVQFDSTELLKRSISDTRYGEYLTKQLLNLERDQNQPSQTTDQSPMDIFIEARSIAQSRKIPLRLRLFIGPNAPELHHLCWEKLCDPRDWTPLLTDENVLFSRYLSNLDWSPVRLRRKTELIALVVVANPDLSEFPLAQVDVKDELDRVESSLEGISLTALASEATSTLTPNEKPTLNNISTYLRDGYDILYLVCHETIKEGEPYLWLENETGSADLVSGNKFVALLRKLSVRPRLVILASCQSAGSGRETHHSDERALAALGAQLTEAGIPAVLAMQGKLTVKTTEKFMPIFFRELQKDGQIDRAMAVARGTIRERPDWWIPVLFMRLKSGRLWYDPGFVEKQGEEIKWWPTLLNGIRRKRCTPILGPGLSESLLGSRREIARRWAETYHFPLSPGDREDLSKVAQYMTTEQGSLFLRDSLIDHIRQELFKRYKDDVHEELQESSLDELLRISGTKYRDHHPMEPYRLLAKLPFSIYINTDFTSLLADALVATGKEPQVELCPWNDHIESPSIYEKEPDYVPDEQRPLVYHLFGSLTDLESIVLTEDDYSNFLIGVARNADLIPDVVQRSLADTMLLFLDFQIINDKTFDTVLRSVMLREGSSRRSKHSHTLQSIIPEEGRILEPERARRYLEKYFQDVNLNIYWGSAENFTQELYQHWKGSNDSAATPELKEATYQAELSLVTSMPAQMSPGEKLKVGLAIKNVGSESWSPTGPDMVMLGYRIFPDDSISGSVGGLSQPVTQIVKPGSSLEMDISFTAPASTGDYRVVWDLSYGERQEYFSEKYGMEPYIIPLTVPPQELEQKEISLEPPSSKQPDTDRKIEADEESEAIASAMTPEKEIESAQEEPPPSIAPQQEIELSQEQSDKQLDENKDTQGILPSSTEQEIEEAKIQPVTDLKKNEGQPEPDQKNEYTQEPHPSAQPTESSSDTESGTRPSGPVTIERETIIQPSSTPPEAPTKHNVVIEVGPKTIFLQYKEQEFTGPNKIDRQELLKILSAERYGELLFDGIVHEDTGMAGLSEFTTSQGYAQALREQTDLSSIQLSFDPNDLSLYAYKWEYLKHPQKTTPLAVSERLPVYRRLRGLSKTLANLEAKPLRILVAFSNPDPLGKSGNTLLESLQPVDIDQERDIMETALERLHSQGDVEYKILDKDVTPATIRENLEEGYHILHLLSHGIFVPTQPAKDKKYYLVMERQDQQEPFVSIAELEAALLAGQQLRLVILAACQSAGPESVDVLKGLGPRLVRSGIPAVIAMQEAVSVETAQLFTQSFYDDLARSGQVDRAMAATRLALYSSKQPWSREWGIPVLLMSTDNGLLFAVAPKNRDSIKPLEPTIKSYDQLKGSGDPTPRRIARALEAENRAHSIGSEFVSALQEIIAAPVLTSAASSSDESAILQQNRDLLTRQIPDRLDIDARKLKAYVEEQGSKLQLLNTAYSQIASALNTGKHLIFIGPPGTGKTSLANDICAYARHHQFTTGVTATTATADWTTFDTVGGYVPTPQHTLQFHPGIFLRAICLGQWLVIDEINRAEIDKAFGELFTVLSGQQVELPYTISEQQVRVLPPSSADPADWVPAEAQTDYDYVMHPNWRIIATMNVYDKSYLFAMSLAFMRRFAFIDIELPPQATYLNLCSAWMKSAGIAETDAFHNAMLERLKTLLDQQNPFMRQRALGPAIIKDLLEYIGERYRKIPEPDELAGEGFEQENLLDLFGEAFLLYVAPQLDGLGRDEILAIYHYTHTLFENVSDEVRQLILTRIQALYPHIPSKAWEAPSKSSEDGTNQE